MLDTSDRVLWNSIQEWLRDEKIVSRPAALILYAMASEGYSYKEALNAYCECFNAVPERVHPWICYAILDAGLDEGPETILQTFIDERGLGREN